MDFQESETQAAIRELAREILQAEATAARVKASEAAPAWQDDALLAKLAEANLLGIAIPEQYGGMGMGFAELCILLEELGRACIPGPWLASLVCAGLPLAEFANETQRKTWLPKLAAGRALATAALPDADFCTPQLRAEKSGAGYALHGEAQGVPAAADAALLLLPAAAPEGGALFALANPAQAPELSMHKHVHSTGEPLYHLQLNGASCAAADALPGDAAAALRWLQPRYYAAIAALQLGVAERAVQITAEYTRERRQFGAPIATFQAVQHRQADSYIALQAMRLTAWRARWRIGAGLPAAREAATAKWWAAEGGAQVARACVHLHGGIGADVDYPIHRYFLWAKALELRGGGGGETLASLGAQLAAEGPAEEQT